MKPLLLGFGRADFTPDTFPLSMNSTINATEIYDRLFATCLAWQDEKTTVLQYSMDLRNIYQSFYEIISKAISEATGIPVDHLVLSVTHNHSSPDVNLLDRPEIHDWLYRIGIPAMCEAGRAALADLAPVTGAVAGKTETKKLGFVRRYFRADGSFYSIGSKMTDSPLAACESIADPELRAVRVKREGKKAVVLVNFQTHAASGLGTHRELVHSDFITTLRRDVEKSGEDLCVYLQGACGNVNCNARLPEDLVDWPDDCFKIGESMAKFVATALAEATPLSLGEIRLRNDTLTCKVNHAKTHLAEEAKRIRDIENQEERIAARTAAGITTKYELAAIIRRSTFGKTREMPLSALVMGELAMGFAPVELFDTCGRAFRETSHYPMTFFVGYTNGSHSYMPSALAFPNGGYEPLECHYVPGTGEMIALKLSEMIHHV